MLAAMTRRTFIFLALLLLSLGFTASELGTRARAFEQPESESGFQPKPLVTAKKHMVVAAHPLAAEAGLAILRKGGNAVDAGIAVQMVLNLVEPQSSGLGGGGYILYWDAGSKQLASIDGRETAPAGATPELFLAADGKPLPRDAAMASGLSVGVPGALAALALAHDKYGKLPWAKLFEPAIALARDGFPISPRLAQRLAEADPLSFAPAARAYFFDAQGRPWPVGYKLANPGLPTPSRRSPATAPRLSIKATSPKTSPARCKTTRASRASSPLGTSRPIGPSSASRSARPIAPTKSAAWGRRPPAALPWRRCSASSIHSISALHPWARVPRMSSPKRSGSLSPTARVTSPIWISFPSRSPGCSIRLTLPNAAP